MTLLVRIFEPFPDIKVNSLCYGYILFIDMHDFPAYLYER